MKSRRPKKPKQVYGRMPMAPAKSDRGSAGHAPAGTREQALASKAFAESLSERFRAATRQAVDAHHARGRSVHGMTKGRLVELAPVTPRGRG